MTSKKEEALRLAAAALDPEMLPRFERRAPRVAMNAVTDFTGELGKVEKDLFELARDQMDGPDARRHMGDQFDLIAHRLLQETGEVIDDGPDIEGTRVCRFVARQGK